MIRAKWNYTQWSTHRVNDKHKFQAKTSSSGRWIWWHKEQPTIKTKTQTMFEKFCKMLYFFANVSLNLERLCILEVDDIMWKAISRWIRPIVRQVHHVFMVVGALTTDNVVAQRTARRQRCSSQTTDRTPSTYGCCPARSKCSASGHPRGVLGRLTYCTWAATNAPDKPEFSLRYRSSS